MPKIPANKRGGELDKYDVAYLQGGVVEVLKLASLSLIEKGYVQFKVSKSKKSSRFAKDTAVKNGGVLSPIEANILALIKDKNTEIKEFIFSGSVSSKVEKMFESRLKKLDEAGYLWTDKQLKKINVLKWVIVITILAVGMSKVIYAVSNGHYNIILLLIEMGVFFGFSAWASYDNLSYSAKSAIKEWKNNKGEGLKNSYKTNSLDDNLNLVAYYGLDVLSIGLWLDYYEHFDTITHASSIGFGCGTCSTGSTWGGSGCSSSCGSSCGSGCGGGCGGCS